MTHRPARQLILRARPKEGGPSEADFMAANEARGNDRGMIRMPTCDNVRNNNGT